MKSAEEWYVDDGSESGILNAAECWDVYEGTDPSTSGLLKQETLAVIRRIQADAAADMRERCAKACEELAESQRRYLKASKPQETVVISAVKLAEAAFNEAERAIRALPLEEP